MPDAGYLTIGKVVKRLQASYPDLSVSKVRYLEDEGLLSPSRTPSGYRLYSQRDIKRLETILYLQKNRFLPLSVIKEQLDHVDSGHGSMPSVANAAFRAASDDDEARSKLHPLERMPEVAGVAVGFVRQLADAGIIVLKKSPHGRDLVDGQDLALIHTCEELRRYGFEARNLRQYVTAANRESAMFEQALSVYARKGGGVEMEHTEETRQQFDTAFTEMLALTGAVRDALIARRIKQSFKGMDA